MIELFSLLSFYPHLSFFHCLPRPLSLFSLYLSFLFVIHYSVSLKNAVSKLLLQRNGGTTQLESEGPGLGCTCSLSLPAFTYHQDDGAPRRESSGFGSNRAVDVRSSTADEHRSDHRGDQRSSSFDEHRSYREDRRNSSWSSNHDDSSCRPGSSNRRHRSDSQSSADNYYYSNSRAQQIRLADGLSDESDKSWESTPMRVAPVTWNGMSFARNTAAGNSMFASMDSFAVDMEAVDAVNNPEDTPRVVRVESVDPVVRLNSLDSEDPVASYRMQRFNDSIVAAKTFTKAESVSLYTYDPKKVLLRGVCSTNTRKGTVPLPATVAGEAFRTGQVQRIVACRDDLASNNGSDNVRSRSSDGPSGSGSGQQRCRLSVPVLDGHGNQQHHSPKTRIVNKKTKNKLVGDF